MEPFAILNTNTDIAAVIEAINKDLDIIIKCCVLAQEGFLPARKKYRSGLHTIIDKQFDKLHCTYAYRGVQYFVTVYCLLTGKCECLYWLNRPVKILSWKEYFRSKYFSNN